MTLKELTSKGRHSNEEIKRLDRIDTVCLWLAVLCVLTTLITMIL